ncbi:uncharacterized protein LOC120291418 isoform X2 [Eucalyptus grandis]|uniref:uncharacterized protein LOC120291418 isoform X2 n=1 Tax=Eucalyptus grandis TaxID=71139 RepID=UPI00192E8DC8|nr:uncharacterized protein LOC120291418 isoform X2 [Eucalyptus grandis]
MSKKRECFEKGPYSLSLCSSLLQTSKLRWSSFSSTDNTFHSMISELRELSPIELSTLPLLHKCLRLQCLYNERCIMHGFSSSKHFSTILAVVMRMGHDLRRGVMWKIIAAASSGIATIVNIY